MFGLLTGLAYFLSFTNASVSDCSKATALFDITSMSFSPDPPVKGQNSTLLLSMNVPTEVQGGTATYSVTYNFIPLTPTVNNLCTELPLGCPIKQGALDTMSSIPFDGSLSGQITIKIEWKDLQAQQLMCVSIRTTL
jgi:hypothetical protein